MKKSGRQPNSFGYSIDMSIDPVYGPPKDGWKTIDIEATQKQPVKLVVEIRTRKSTVILTCTTRDLKVKETVRRKRTAKKDKPITGDTKSVIAKAHQAARVGVTTKGATIAIQAGTKKGDESEQP